MSTELCRKQNVEKIARFPGPDVSDSLFSRELCVLHPRQKCRTSHWQSLGSFSGELPGIACTNPVEERYICCTGFNRERKSPSLCHTVKYLLWTEIRSEKLTILVLDA